jgi:Family of unknown function (DUF6335)
MAKSKPPRRAAKSRRSRPARPRAARKARKAAPKRARKTSGRAKAARPRKRPARAGAGARAKKPAAPRARAARRPAAKATARPRAVRLDRERKRLDEVVPTPPSSLNMNRRGSAARTGRAELADELGEHRGMTPAITGGDVDVDLEDAYFTGDEAPGGDNPTPDQDIVDDIGKALGVQYDDNEELKASDKVTARDRHRWELDPASSEDYKERK